MGSKKYCLKNLTPPVRDIPITEPSKEMILFAHACHSENTVYSFSSRANCVCKKTCKILSSWTRQRAPSWAGWKCLNRKLWLKEIFHVEYPLTDTLKSTCTRPSYSEVSQAPEFLILCMSRVTSVPESRCQPPTQLGAGLEIQWSITHVPQETLKRFCFHKIVVPAASLWNRSGRGICL